MTDSDLDALVRNEVMGLSDVPASMAVFYSTTGDGMLDVIDAMRTKGWMMYVEGDAEYGVEFTHKLCRGQLSESDSLPRAVCLAALKAIRSEDSDAR